MSETPINGRPQQRRHPLTRTAFRFAFVYLLRQATDFSVALERFSSELYAATSV
jgi:hypothetical protein